VARATQELILEEVPDISYDDTGGLPGRSSRSGTPSSFRTCTPTCSRNTSSSRRRGFCCTARPLREDADRQGGANSLAKQVAAKTAQEEGALKGKSFF